MGRRHMGEGAPARGRLLPIHAITPLTARPGIQTWDTIWGYSMLFFLTHFLIVLKLSWVSQSSLKQIASKGFNEIRLSKKN